MHCFENKTPKGEKVTCLMGLNGRQEQSGGRTRKPTKSTHRALQPFCRGGPREGGCIPAAPAAAKPQVDEAQKRGSEPAVSPCFTPTPKLLFHHDPKAPQSRAPGSGLLLLLCKQGPGTKPSLGPGAGVGLPGAGRAPPGVVVLLLCNLRPPCCSRLHHLVLSLPALPDLLPLEELTW